MKPTCDTQSKDALLGTSLLGRCLLVLVPLVCGLMLQAAHAQGLTLVSTALASSSEAPLAGVTVYGNYAYVGGMSSGYYTGRNIGVRIVDLSDPANPQLVGRIPLRRRGTHANHSHGDAVVTHINTGAFQGDVAIVLNGVPDAYPPASYPQPYGIWDVTDPGNPEFLSVLNLGKDSHISDSGDLGDKPYDAKAVAGNYFYALYEGKARPNPRDYKEDNRLAVVDISDPLNPEVVGDWQDNSEVWLMGLSVNQSGTRAYITGQWPPPYNYQSTHGYLYILDIQNPSQPVEIGRYVFPLRGTISSVFIARPTSDDALVVLADGSWADGRCGILHILDTANPAAIHEISTFELPPSSVPDCQLSPHYIATDIAIRGNMVYSTWLAGGVRAHDISDPTNPVEVGLFYAGREVVSDPELSDIALLGTDLVVATTVWDSGLFILSGPAAIPPTPTAVEEGNAVPAAYALQQNYPNPFNPSTEIHFGLSEAAKVQLVVYDMMGLEVARLVDGALPAGQHRATWDASGLPSGTYLYRLTAGAFTETKAMTLLK